MRSNAAVVLAALLVVSAPGLARAAAPAAELGFENFLYPTVETLLNRDNVLGLRDPEDLLRLTAGVRQSWRSARFVGRGYVEKRIGGDAKVKIRQAYAQNWWGSVLGMRVGKQRIAWGSGFAWNPTSRIEPPKNPLNAGLEQQGAWAVRADVVPNSKTGLILVASRGRTEPGDLPFDAPRIERRALAARLRRLFGATDVAVILSGGRNLRTLAGLDVTRGLGGLWAAHAEASFYRGAELLPRRDDRHFFRIAAGALRTSGETALSFEYFYNGEGYGDSTAAAYRAALANSFATAANPALPQAVREQARAAYLAGASLPYSGGLGLRRNYLHAGWSRAHIAERFTANLRAVLGIDDGGLALTPGVSFAPSGSVTIGVDGIVLLGPQSSEYRLAPVRGALQSRLTWSF